MTHTTTLPDLRPALAQSHAWVAELIAGVRPDQWDAPTPCTDWTVRDLVGHLFAVQSRIEANPAGSVNHLPSTLPVPDADAAAAFRTAAERGAAAWSDEALASTVVRPYGEVPGAVAVADFTREHLVHGWDLATATGQDPEALGDLAATILPSARQFLPAEIRGAGIPFDPVVEPAADAGPTEQLANWLGRRSR